MTVDEFGLVEAVDSLGECIVVAVDYRCSSPERNPGRFTVLVAWDDDERGVVRSVDNILLRVRGANPGGSRVPAL